MHKPDKQEMIKIIFDPSFCEHKFISILQLFEWKKAHVCSH